MVSGTAGITPTLSPYLVLLLLLAPIFSAGALTIEKEQRTLGGLLTSMLRPAQIWWGKFAASLMFVLLLLIIGMPVLSAVCAFGGVGPWEIGMVALTTVIVLGTSSSSFSSSPCLATEPMPGTVAGLRCLPA